ncbi:MAG: GC-type dockerin domain-anchored protein [Phycisphaerales bacterium]|jgi:hypothetical protein|nr:GC-type dockerin domain-anchored protein [Phycisphaerales bacterium]
MFQNARSTPARAIAALTLAAGVASIAMAQPCSPTAGVPVWQTDGYRIDVANDIAVTTGNGVFRIWDLATDPPQLVSETVDQAVDVATDGHTLFTVVANSQDVAVWDISSPSTPLLIGTIPHQGPFLNAAELSLVGETLYVFHMGSDYRFIRMYDVSNPAAPVLLDAGFLEDYPGLYTPATDGSLIIGARLSYIRFDGVPNSHQTSSFFYIDDWESLNVDWFTVAAHNGVLYLGGYSYDEQFNPVPAQLLFARLPDDGSHLLSVESMPLPEGGPYALSISDDRLAVTMYRWMYDENGVIVSEHTSVVLFDISEPLAPRYLSTLDLPDADVGGVGWESTALSANRGAVLINHSEGATLFPFELHCVNCPADLDGDGALTSSDFLMYLNAFDTHDPAADVAPVGGDGSWDSSDFLAYLNLYSQGC